MPWLTADQVQNYGLWIQSGAIVFSLIGVIIGISANRRIARRRATLDVIMAEQSTEFLYKSRQEFIKLREAGHLVQWADPKNISSSEHAILRQAMNRYELIAIGIREKTLDERVYKRYTRSTVVADWRAIKPWVIQLRQTRSVPTFYNEIERLGKKWATKEERKHC